MNAFEAMESIEKIIEAYEKGSQKDQLVVVAIAAEDIGIGINATSMVANYGGEETLEHLSTLVLEELEEVTE